MDRLLNLFIISIYLTSSLFVLSILGLSGYLLTVSLKKKKKRYFALSFLLLLLAPLVSLSLFRVPIGRASAIYILGTIIALSTIVQLHRAFPVKTNWMFTSLLLSLIAIFGFPLIYFWYGNVATPEASKTAHVLAETSQAITTKLTETAEILRQTSQESPITSLPKDIETNLADLYPSYVIVSSTDYQVIYSTKYSEITGDLSVWFPWVTDVSEGNSSQGIASLPNGTPLAIVSYHLPESYVGAKMITVAYRLTGDYFRLNPTALQSLAVASNNGIIWSTSSLAPEKAILESRGLNEYVKEHTEAEMGIIESNNGLYDVLTKPLPSLDHKSYSLVSLSEL